MNRINTLSALTAITQRFALDNMTSLITWNKWHGDDSVLIE